MDNIVNINIYFLTVAVLALIYLFLSINVIKHRRDAQVLYGSGGNIAFDSVIRAHGNFQEYVPISLFLLEGLVYFDISTLFLVLLCILLIAARVSHAVGLTKFEAQKKPDLRFRKYGVMGTFTVLIISSGYLIIKIICNLLF